MSQSIRICSGVGGPILQHIPNTTSSSCMFLSTEVGNGFPINLSSSMKECKKRAWISSVVVVSNRNHPRLPFLIPCATTMNSNVDEDDTSKVKYDDPLKVVLLGVLQAWWIILSNFRSSFRYNKVTKGVKSNVDEDDTRSKGKYDDPLKVLLLGVSQAWSTFILNFRSSLLNKIYKEALVLTIRLDRHDPIDGLRVLLDASRAWRCILSKNRDELFDAKDFDDHHGKSYLRKARMEGDINKGKHNSRSRIYTRVTIIRILADLNDPNDGLEILSGALELWRTRFSSNELNDSEGYLQKEIFAIRDLSHRISVYNRIAKHDEAKKRTSQIIHSLAIYKLMIDNFDDPGDAIDARREAFRCYTEGVECDGIIGLMVDEFAKLLQS